MIDLVERLENLILHRGDMISLGFEAAAEIKRLRAALAGESDEAERLYNLLSADHEQFVYKTSDGGWAVTGGRGVVSASAVERLVRDRRIRSCYSSTPYEAYGAGPTIDMDATMKARKTNRKAGLVLVYVEEPQK